MDIIADFVAQYVREFDFYNQAARHVSNNLETELRAAGIRAILSSRAKDADSLRQKCEKRNATQNYSSVKAIYEDIVDLGGVRVALYFPGEREQVDKVIRRLFNILETKTFPEDTPRPRNKRFSGYSASHYRITLKEEGLTESDRRYASARIEIQVASVLMHAWSEVEHDLSYKPLSGRLSGEEYAILDQLNGLVLAGEMSLESLQRAGELRVANTGTRLQSHYDLASLLSRSIEVAGQPLTDAGLGRVDLLFRLLQQLGLDETDRISPYLSTLHSDVEQRPLADQVIDALLADREDRYQVYEDLREQMYPSVGTESVEYRQALGEFIAAWILLEVKVRDVWLEIPGVNPVSSRPGLPPITTTLRDLPLDEETRGDIDYLRQLRNGVIHGMKQVSVNELRHAVGLLQEVMLVLKSLGESPAD